jgi:hypothetical protein
MLAIRKSIERTPLAAAALVVVVTLFQVDVAIAQDAAATVRLGARAKDFAFDPLTGNVAAADPHSDEVLLFKTVDLAADGKLDPIVRVRVGDAPALVVFKRLGDKRYFVVGCMRDAAVYLLAADDLKLESRIPVARPFCDEMFTSASPVDPYLFMNFFGNDSPGTLAVNLAKRIDEGAVEGLRLGRIAADGRLAYARPTVVLRRTGPLDVKPKFEDAFHPLHLRDELVLDRRGEYAAAGEAIMNPTLDKSLGFLIWRAEAFLSERPIIVGFNDDRFDLEEQTPDSPGAKLLFASSNSFKQIGEAAIPMFYLLLDSSKTIDDENDEFASGGYPTRIFSDDARGRVILARRDHLSVVNLAALKLPDEPMLGINVAGKIDASPGRTNLIPLRPVDSRVKLSLVDPTDDLKLTPEGLEWTPGTDQLGDRTIEIRLTFENLETKRSLVLHLARNEIILPFMGDGLALSPNAREAVAWSVPIDPPSHGHPPPTEHFSRAAIVNLSSGKVETAGVLPHVPRRATLDASNIYTADDNIVTVIDRATFKSKRRVFLDSDVVGLAAIPGGKLLVCLADGRRIRYSVPDLKMESDLPAADKPAFISRDEHIAPGEIRLSSEALEFGEGDVFDHGLSKPLLLERVTTLTTINSSRHKPHPGYPRPSATEPNHVWSADKQILAVVGSADPRALVALAYSAATTERSGNWGTRKTLKGYSLEVWHPDDWSIQPQVVPLSTDAAALTTRLERKPRGRGDVVVRDGIAWCLCGDRIVKSTFAPPAGGPTFVRRQSTLVLDRAAKTTLKHSVAGGDGPYQFSLANPTPGLTIEADGTILADGAQLAAHAVDVVAGSLDPQSQVSSPSRLSSADELDRYVARTAATFRQWTGRDPQGVPLAVAVHVVAADSQSRSASLVYHLLLEVPRREFDQRMTTLAARAAEARAIAADPAKSAEKAQSLERRLAALEEQLKRLTEELAKRLEQ